MRRLIDFIRRRWPCFLRSHIWRYRQAIDPEAAAHGFLWLFYGYRCIRCGNFEPMGVLRRERMTSDTHAEYLRTGCLPPEPPRCRSDERREAHD